MIVLNTLVWSIRIADSFRRTHANVLAFIDNGEFIDALLELENNAKNLLRHAKLIENESLNVEESYEAYEHAYNAYDSLYKFITTRRAKSEKMKSQMDSEIARKYRKSKIANIVMGAITVASIAVTIVSFFI